MIVVGGENLVDLVLDGRGKVAARPGGGPYNTARTVSRLGEDCAYLGSIGGDGFGRLIRTKLELDGVDLRLCGRRPEPTTLAVAEVDASGAAEYHFYHHDTASVQVDTSGVQGLDRLDAVHLGTLGLVWEPMASAFRSLIDSLSPHVTLMLDPNCRPAAVVDRAGYLEGLLGLVGRADIVKVSTDDLRFIDPDADPETAAARLIDLGASVVLTTAGGDAVVVTTNKESVTIVPPKVDVIDTIGAGDAFGGAFLAYWVRHGWSTADLPTMDELVAAAEFGCLVGSMTCQVVGAEPPTAAALPDF